MSSFSLGASPIQSLLQVVRFTRCKHNWSFTSSSLPGHLLHYVVEGHVRQRCNGRSYELSAGDVLWYHEDEWVEGVITKAPWEVISVNFVAPALLPPRENARHFSPAPPAAPEYFYMLHRDWEDENLAGHSRMLRLHAHLLLLLDSLSAPLASAISLPHTESASLWWQLETKVRGNLCSPVNLKQLEEWSGHSAATIARSCQLAVGASPMRRIKQIRMSFAQGLVRLSDLSFSQIATRVGYRRVHEFSRDYHRNFGVSPTADRKQSTSSE